MPDSWTRWDDVPLSLRTGQVCQLLGVDRNTLEKLAQTGQIARGRVGSHWRYGKAEVRRFLDDSGVGVF